MTPSSRAPRSADLRSAGPPPAGPGDHLQGEEGPLVIEYGDFECPYCARLHFELAPLRIRRVFRHFPVPSKHPRARALANAAEAAALQGRFWEMHDSLFADQGHLDDPHLWRRVEELGLDLERFEAERRSVVVEKRVTRDFRSGVRAGVMSTPTLFVEGERVSRARAAELISQLAQGPDTP